MVAELHTPGADDFIERVARRRGARLGNSGDPTRLSRVRLLNVACRSVHLVGVSLLVGGAAWDVEWARLVFALWLTLGSGLALLLLEVVADPGWLGEGRGLAAGLKLAPLGLMPFAPDQRGLLLLAVVVIGAVGSHMPRWFRHAALADHLKRLGGRRLRPERDASR